MPTSSQPIKSESNQLKKVYLVDGARTPFLVQANHAEKYSSIDLSVIISRALLLRHAFPLSDLDSIISATSQTSCHSNTNTVKEQAADLAFNLMQRLSDNKKNHANSATSTISFTGEIAGFHGLQHGYQQIALDLQQLILFIAVDTFTENRTTGADFSTWKQQWHNSHGIKEKYQTLNSLHTSHFSNHGNMLSIPSHYPNQQLAIKRADQKALLHGLKKQPMHDYAQLSQRRLQYAQRNNLLKSVIPLFYRDGQVIRRDEGVLLNNPNTRSNDLLMSITNEAIAPAAEGATALLLASEEAVTQYQLPVLAEISAPLWSNNINIKSNVTPIINQATTTLLSNHSLTIDEISYWEINESSAVDVLYAQKTCSQHEPVATLSHVNIDGGALSLGNPPAANHLRMLLQLAVILKRQDLSGQATKNQKTTMGLLSSSFSDDREFAMLVKAI